MEKKTKAAIILAVCAALLVPDPYRYPDNDSVSYNAVLYSVTKVRVRALDADGYDIGTEVRILFWTVYDDVRYYPLSEAMKL